MLCASGAARHDDRVPSLSGTDIGDAADPSGRGSTGRRTAELSIFWGGAALLVVAHVFRNLAGIDTRELWLDEASTYYVFTRPLASIPRLAVETHAQPPLYYLLLHALGSLGSSELLLRGFSWLCVLALLAYVLAGDVPMTGPARLVFGALLVVGDRTQYLAWELRPYALSALAALPASVCFLEAVREPSRRNVLRYFVATLVLLSALAFGVWVFATHLLFAAVAFVSKRLRERRVLVVFPALALLYLPYLVAALRTQGHIGDPSAGQALRAIARWSIYPAGIHEFTRLGRGGWDWLALAGAIGFVIARRKHPFELAFFFVLIIGQIAFVHGFMKGRSWVADRYLTPAYPVLLFVTAQGLASLPDLVRWRSTRIGALAVGALAALALVIGSARGFVSYLGSPKPPATWRALRREVAALAPGRKAVFFDCGSDGLAFQYETRNDPDIEVLTQPKRGWESAGANAIDPGYVAENIDRRRRAACFLYQRDRSRDARFNALFVPKMNALGFVKVFERPVAGHASPQGVISGYCRR